MGRGRRPAGPEIVEQAEGSADAKRRLRVILETVAGMKSVPLTPESIASFDAVLISTAHSDIDYNMVVEHARLVIDTRNATKTITCHRDKIFKA